MIIVISMDDYIHELVK